MDLVTHKVFFSFYHAEDEDYKNSIEAALQGQIINKSVQNGEYDSDLSTEYIKALIRDEKVSDSSIIAVLIGPNTWKRKHVDWEIYAGLRPSVNGTSGLIGIFLPSYNLREGRYYNSDTIPARLYDNVKSGFAKLYTFETFIRNYRLILDEAFQDRIKKKMLVNNTRVQMQRNLS